MGGSGASVEGGIAVTRELVLSPLSMCYIPPEYSCISSAIMTSTAGGSGKDGTKKAGWDLPSTAVGGTGVCFRVHCELQFLSPSFIVGSTTHLCSREERERRQWCWSAVCRDTFRLRGDGPEGTIGCALLLVCIDLTRIFAPILRGTAL